MSGSYGEQPERFKEMMSYREAQDKAYQVGGTHYQSKVVQPWTAMESWMTPEQFAGYLRGNAIKYLARCEDKGGVEDMQKAQHYLAKLIEFKTKKGN